jgi:hypothetical protein
MKKMTLMMLTAAMMTVVGGASAADRDTPERDGRFVRVTAGAAIDAGMMVAILPADGEAYQATDATATLAVLGRAENSAVEGDYLTVKRGVFRWDNAGAFTKASLGLNCYVLGAASVTTAAIATNDIIAGVIVDYDTSGVWVDTYNQKVTLTTSVASLAVSGAGTVGTTLGVTGAATFGSTVGITGVATLTAAPKVTAVTAAGDVTATATNAPALSSAAAPKWVTVTIGSDTCVVPAYKIQ